MKTGWRDCLLGDVVTFQRGYDLPHSAMIPGPYPVMGSNGQIGWHHEYTTADPCITIGRSGNVGNPHLSRTPSWAHNTTLFVKEFRGVDPIFIFYFLKTLNLSNFGGGSAVPTLNRNHIHTLPISLPPLETQKKIAAVLGALDDKIELNRKMNENLEAQAQTLFKSWFVDFTPFGGKMPKDWKKGIASDFFDISIGKTPPRKKQELFSEQQSGNVVWVSIADMGKCSAFIAGSSEYLTPEAISMHGVTIVPRDTILLSFKLTVGRVAISACELATNEAIAHFKTSNRNLREYTYLALKGFQYNSLGSTSSIATAVNSKTIKAMPFVRPADDVLNKFSQIARPLFEQIRLQDSESRKLAEMRDALLPKLMKGEVEV